MRLPRREWGYTITLFDPVTGYPLDRDTPRERYWTRRSAEIALNARKAVLRKRAPRLLAQASFRVRRLGPAARHQEEGPAER